MLITLSTMLSNFNKSLISLPGHRYFLSPMVTLEDYNTDYQTCVSNIKGCFCSFLATNL